MKAVSTASRTVSQKSSIPALEGILLEAGSVLRLTGYNLETGIRTTVPADVTQPGSLVLSARLFGEIVRKMPDDIVYFTSNGYMVNIKCGLSEFNILATDAEEFPELPSVDANSHMTIDEIAKAFEGTSTPYLSVVDRAEAIRTAVAHSRAGDILVLAGKGHEKYEIDKNGKRPFDEEAIVKECLNEYRQNKKKDIGE